jgi:hypothetical protein
MHSGGLAPDEVPIIAQEGEIMIQRSVAQQPGMAEFLLGLNAGEFHEGGFIPGGRYHRGSGGPSGSITGGQSFTGTGRFQIFNPNSPDYAPDLPGVGPDETGNTFDDPFDNPLAGRFFSGFGTSPFSGISVFGPTQIPTLWVDYPGVGNVPMAVPVGGWQSDPTQPWSGARTQYLPKTKHLGGPIGRMHLGGSIGRFPRMHSGGSLSLGGSTLHSGGAGGHVTILNFTDLRTLTKQLASAQGRKIIVDTVRGNRIDLGL